MATSKDKVFLEAANELEFNELITPDFQILRGDVRFRKDSMYMFCDSAYFYEKTNSLDAFGNVRMEQGDTLFIYGDELYYDGETQLARIRHNVRMINRDVVLTTDSFNYDMEINIGYYFNGGEVADTVNRLNSFYGQYSPDTKNAVFNYDVKLFNPQFTLYSDTLEYNTTTKVADILGPSVIVSDSNTIYSSLGFYNTAEDVAQLYNRSLIVSKSQKLTGDTIFYDRNNGFGEVFGHMVVDDTLRMMQMHGHYGFYNERREESFATDSALMIDYSQPDTLYLHADTLESLKLNNIKRVLLAYHDVRIFRNDMQAICDSIIYKVEDSVLVMMDGPIMWNLDYQIFGDTIKVYMNDSTIDWAHIPAFAFATQQKDTAFFDQLSGKDLKAYFTNGDITRVDVSGNVQTIFYPQESDMTFTGMNKAETSFLTMYMKNRQMDKLKMWPTVDGTMTPISKLKPDMIFLPDYKWYENYRPKNKADVFRETRRPRSEIKKVRHTEEFFEDEEDL
ncbi:MAG TPA: hypothetical protein IAD09_09230 [Candidatus Caccoplasma merdavium]|nr:hypothetical protein [Candidatus Caccoplasma merdavium]